MRFTFHIQTIYVQKKSFNLAQIKSSMRWLSDLKGKQGISFILELFINFESDTARLSTKKMNNTGNSCLLPKANLVYKIHG